MSVLEDLLAGRLADPDGGAVLRVPTRSLVIGDSLEGREAALVEALDLGGTLAVVSDPATRAALGARVERALGSFARVMPVMLGERPHADHALAAHLSRETEPADALVAVGSGTINDLCKYVAARSAKPYAVFGTAPSMNGYTSVNAAITVEGHKKSLPAVAPQGVFLDLTVLASAPPRLIRSGLGDSLCRPTAQADWLLAHLLFDRPYREAPFVLLAEDEASLFAESAALMAGDLEAMARLARTLVLSGFGMTLCGGSFPASQGEHLISHTIEMTATGLSEAYHGEQIGVTTLTMARLYEHLLERGSPRVVETAADEASVVAHFGAELGRACWSEFAGKCLDRHRAEALNQRLETIWPTLVERLGAVLRPSADLEAVLLAAGAPTRPSELEWPMPLYGQAIRHAREVRDRYTALDLAADAVLLEDFVRAECEGQGHG